jgi:thioredoxin 1
MVLNLNAENFDEEVFQSEKPVIVDFWAEWCTPCKMLAPIFEEVAEEYEDRVKFAKLNVGEAPEITARFGITAIPTLLVFYRGKVIDRMTGVVPKEVLKGWIEKILSALE